MTIPKCLRFPVTVAAATRDCDIATLPQSAHSITIRQSALNQTLLGGQAYASCWLSWIIGKRIPRSDICLRHCRMLQPTRPDLDVVKDHILTFESVSSNTEQNSRASFNDRRSLTDAIMGSDLRTVFASGLGRRLDSPKWLCIPRLCLVSGRQWSASGSHRIMVSMAGIDHITTSS